MSFRQPGFVRMAFRRFGASSGGGSGPSANAFYVVTQATNAPVNAFNLGGLATGVLEQTVAASVSTPSVLTMTTGAIPFGNLSGSGLLAQDNTRLVFQWSGLPSNVVRVGIGTATPGSSVAFGVAWGTILDVYTPNSGGLSVLNLASYFSPLLAFTMGVRGGSPVEWMPGNITVVDGFPNANEGHVQIQVNKNGTSGTTSANNQFVAGDFYAGTTTNSGVLCVPQGIAIGVGIHGTHNGLYATDSGIGLVIQNDDASLVSPTGIFVPDNFKLRYFRNGGTTDQAQISFRGGAYTNLLTGTFTAGSVIFAGGVSTLSQDAANFSWDSTNHRLGIGHAVAGLTSLVSIIGSGGGTHGAENVMNVTSNATYDKWYVTLGGGPAVSTGTPYYYVDWDTVSTTVTPGAALTLVFTHHFRQQTFTLASGAATLIDAATVWIDGPPVFTGAGSFGTGYNNEAFHVDSGISSFVGIVQVLNSIGGSQLFYADGPGARLSFYGQGPVTQRTNGNNITNNVTAGGTTATIADFAAAVYATDGPIIRNDIFQLAAQLKIVNDGLRTIGLFT